MFTFNPQPNTIRGIIADGFRLYNASISKIWYWQLIFVIPSTILGRIDAWLNPNADLSMATWGYGSFIVVTTLVMVLTLLAGHCFTYSRMYAVAIQGDTSAKASLSLSLRRTLYVLLGILVVLAGIALIVVPLFFLFSKTASTLVAFVGMVVLYGITISMIVFTMLTPLFILLENQGVLTAIKNSIMCVRKNFMRTLTTLFLISLMGLLAGFAILLLPLGLFSTFGNSQTALIVGLFSLFFGYIAIYAFAVPVFNAVMLTLYRDLKARRNYPQPILEEDMGSS